MKIKDIKQEETSTYCDSIFVVTFEPTWFERVFLKKTETSKKYKENGYIYMFGSGNLYINQTGKELGNGNRIGEAIDKFRRKW